MNENKTKMNKKAGKNYITHNGALKCLYAKVLVESTFNWGFIQLAVLNRSIAAFYNYFVNNF